MSFARWRFSRNVRDCRDSDMRSFLLSILLYAASIAVRPIHTMSKVVAAATSLLLLTACAAFATTITAFQTPRAATDHTAEAWVSEIIERVADSVFDPPMSVEGLDRNTVWVVTARILPAYETDPEMQLSLRKLANGNVNAIVTTLPQSLKVQLMRTYLRDRDATVAEIAKRIERTRWVLTPAECPELPRIAARFEKLRTNIALENALFLDSKRYQLWVDADAQRAQWDLLGASSGESRHPIIRWIEETSQALRKATPRGIRPAA